MITRTCTIPTPGSLGNTPLTDEQAEVLINRRRLAVERIHQQARATGTSTAAVMRTIPVKQVLPNGRTLGVLHWTGLNRWQRRALDRHTRAVNAAVKRRGNEDRVTNYLGEARTRARRR